MKDETLVKLKQAKSAGELIALAKELGKELTAQQAEELFDRLHGMSDDQLDAVAGGVDVDLNALSPSELDRLRKEFEAFAAWWRS